MTRLQSIICSVLAAAIVGSGSGGWAQSSGPGWLARMRVLPDEHERSHRHVKEAFRDVVRDANQSTVRVLVDGMQVALGAVVHADGYVVTKASELQGDVQCLLPDGQRVAARMVGWQPDYDIALLSLAARRLTPVQWSAASAPLPGSWLATTGAVDHPLAIGIVSAAARSLPRPQPVLGVGLEQRGERPLINRVLPGSAAAKAGLRVGDLIVSLNGQGMTQPQAVSAAVRALQPGDEIRVEIVRNEQALSLSAILRDAARAGNQEQAELMDTLGGPLSRRRTGFPYVLEHDTVLRPRECGGPLVDLDGKVVGINIARVSRVSSYALPVSQLKPVLVDLLAGKYPPPVTVNVNSAAVVGE